MILKLKILFNEVGVSSQGKKGKITMIWTLEIKNKDEQLERMKNITASNIKIIQNPKRNFSNI